MNIKNTLAGLLLVGTLGIFGSGCVDPEVATREKIAEMNRAPSKRPSFKMFESPGKTKGLCEVVTQVNNPPIFETKRTITCQKKAYDQEIVLGNVEEVVLLGEKKKDGSAGDYLVDPDDNFIAVCKIGEKKIELKPAEIYCEIQCDRVPLLMRISNKKGMARFNVGSKVECEYTTIYKVTHNASNDMSNIELSNYNPSSCTEPTISSKNN
jgi:hypothetical protein